MSSFGFQECDHDKCLNIEKTRKAGENTMKERLEGDEGIE